MMRASATWPAASTRAQASRLARRIVPSTPVKGQITVVRAASHDAEDVAPAAPSPLARAAQTALLVPLLFAAVSPAGPADACRICRKFGWLPKKETVIVQETVVAEPEVIVVEVVPAQPKSPLEELMGRKDVRQGLSGAVAVATLALALEGTLWNKK